MVRAKFQLTAITTNAWGGTSLKFDARYDETIPEDQRFAKATPSGSLEMHVDNPAALAELQLGKFFYLDFTPVEQ